MKKIITLALLCASTMWASQTAQDTTPVKCACKKIEKCACKAKNKQGKKGMMVTFESIDTNKDGSISKEEFSAHQAERMKNCHKCQAHGEKCNTK